MKRWSLLLVAVASLATLAVPTAARAWHVAPAARQIVGVDAHDGMVYKSGATYYLVGTAYGCGFNWLPGGPETQFCGFSVYRSSDLSSWELVRTLFPPSGRSDYAHMTWQELCAGHGDGCFNPRMVRRPDGVWLLYFNAPYDFRRGAGAAYYVMGCNGPAGPCGADAGGPHGATYKPSMNICYGNGDFSVVEMAPGEAWMFCTRENQTLSSERLDSSWINGTGVGYEFLAKRRSVEAPGVAYVNGKWMLAFSEPHCGYCGGTGTGYALLAPSENWIYRGKLSDRSCNGQPRTMFQLDGKTWLWIDQWTPGSGNQTQAPILLTPIGHDRHGDKTIRCT
jgi:beta-xylosidase